MILRTKPLLVWSMLLVLAAAWIPTGCATGRTTTAAPTEMRLWPEALAQPSTPESHRAAATELFAVLNMEATLAQAIETSLQSQVTANPALRELVPVMRDFLARYMSFESLREPLTQLYVDRFSELELRQLTAFYRTPMGARSLQELPTLMQRSAAIGAARVQENIGELQGMIQQFIRRRGTPEAPATPAVAQ